MKVKPRLVPHNLISLKAKKFEVLLNHDLKSVTVRRNYISAAHEMNSSIEFQYKALQVSDRPRKGKSKETGKIYQLRLFRNGML
jgi:hypothetical protein